MNIKETLAALVLGNITATSGNVIGAIGAGSITGTHIAATTITASNIAASTITGSKIAASTITADHLDVTTLSAISADLGTVTAGTINGAVGYFGTGEEVTLNASGITIAAGDGSSNKVKWSGVGDIWGTGGFLYFNAPIACNSTIQSTGGAGTVVRGYDVEALNLLICEGTPTGSGTAVVWDGADGGFKRDSSSLRYKEHVEAWPPKIAS